MKLYLNELAPWERKNEYLNHIQLGKDVNSQTTILRDAVNNQTRAQLASASAIIASQERIAEGIGELSLGVGRIEQGIESLQAAFEWGISEVVWQIEQNREVLKSILEVLMTPLDTQAKERRKRAENAYSNGWIDDAEEEFLESEILNRYDFAIHISLGMIYLFHKIDKNKALEYFEKAIKYATPESKYYTSYALLYKALIKRDLGYIDEAEQCTRDAISLSPKFAEAIFQNAQYNALRGRQDAALSSLQKAIELDLTYCLKADTDEEFNGIREGVSSLFQNFQQKENNKAYRRWEKFDKQLSFISEVSTKVDKIIGDNDYSSKCNQNHLREKLLVIKGLIDRESILDARNANLNLDSIENDISKFVSDAKSNFDKAVDREESASRAYQYDIEHNQKQRKILSISFFKAIPSGIGCGAIVALIVASIVGAIATTSVGYIFGVFVLIAIYGLAVKSKFEDDGSKFREIPVNVNEKIEKHKSNAKKLKALDFNKIKTI
jgi:tetratricopeptide (TPR) repeat protein